MLGRMRMHTRTRGLAAMVMTMVLAGGVAGCGGPASSLEDSYAIAIREPATLIPGAVHTSAGARVVDALFTGLVQYDPTTSEPLLEVAESISSRDQRHWTITIEKGWTFHNGEPVTSENFVRAWNATAYGPNFWAGNTAFRRIEGYDALNPADPDGPQGPKAPPKPRTVKLSGLEVVDDDTFTVTLREPFSQFPLMLGMPAYFPLPTVAFENLEKFARKPVGNGPYQMTGAWTGGGSIDLTRYDDYTKGDEQASAPEDEEAADYRGGTYEASVRDLTYTFYSDVDAAYRDLEEGKVDIVPSLPPKLFDDAQEDFGSRFVFRPGASFVHLGLPLYGERFDDPRLRRAISMAIDREKLIETYFAEVPTRAESLISPAVPGSREDACADWCEYHPKRAKELFDAAGGYDGTLHLWYSSGSGQRPWMEAVAGMLRRGLGIEKVRFHERQPAAYATAVRNQSLTGPWRLASTPAYPSPQAYLEPLYTTGGRANHTGYSNDRVDALVAQANHARSLDTGVDRYQQAADIVLGDMPVIPLWFANTNAAHSSSVESVIVDAFGHIEVARVEEG